jgi:hypothetical protein
MFRLLCFAIIRLLHYLLDTYKCKTIGYDILVISREIVAGNVVGMLRIISKFMTKFGPGSSVGIATDYGLDGPGIESRWGEIFTVQTGPGAHPASCKMGTGSFPGVKCGWGVLLTTHPF